jgi:CIC family chloride channel protein
MPALAALPAFAVVGILAGVFGVAFNRCLLNTVDLTARFTRQWRFALCIGAGAAAGLVAWFYPLAVGGGHEIAENVLRGQIQVGLIPVLFLLRFVLTIVSYGSGAAGGIFAPLLVLGALLGFGVGHGAHILTPGIAADAGVFAVVGMAAYFTAIVRAPLTGILLITEMTGSYEQMLPLLVSSFCAYGVAEYLRSVPVYEALLERDLRRGGIDNPRGEPIVVEFEVAESAPFAGKRVRELGLPAGCVFVRCYALGREWVPTAETILEPHLRITAVIAPDAENAVSALSQGCSSLGGSRTDE